MGFKCGIVGLPNVGKSTLFNALTETAAAQAANYPFCTIEPNVGEVAVPDPRLETLAALAKSAAIVPTRLTFVDIAGLVRGASKGEGLGNQFLANIREVDAIAHVVRCWLEGRAISADPSAKGGVRVVKGYHAESREEEVFAGGVARLLNNILKSLTATSAMGLSANVLLGIVGATVMFIGTRQIHAHQITLGDFVTFTAFMAFLIAPVAQIVAIGTQLTEALAGLERTREILREARQFNAREFRIVASQAVIDLFLEEESQALAMLGDFIGRPVSMQVESSYTQEQYDVILM